MVKPMTLDQFAKFLRQAPEGAPRLPSKMQPVEIIISSHDLERLCIEVAMRAGPRTDPGGIGDAIQAEGIILKVLRKARASSHD